MSGNGTRSTMSAANARRPLLSSCAIASALVATGHAVPLRAQSFQGTVIGAPIGATVNNGVPGQTTVTVTAPTAIVNWRPNDTTAGPTPINFQAAGTTATFEGIGDFAILNRILPSGPATGRSVLLNGTINGLIGSGTQVQGGSVWFYSPGGLVIGSQAVIDVGSLGLSALDITDNDFLNGDNAFSFAAAANSRAAITIDPGANISATTLSSAGSYVALVAPRIKMGGTVSVDGSAAYVAAEAVDISISGGLFDIAVTTGSAVDPGGEVTLSHEATATTSGPTPSGQSTPRAIYMVAIPKNDAVTMLVGGNVGYAVDAVIDNGDVILSAGRNVDSTSFGSFGTIDFTTMPTSAAGASIQIIGGNFTTDTRASATLDLAANGGAGGSLSFQRFADLYADRNATLTARAGETVTATRPLSVVSAGRNLAGAPTPGAALIEVLAGASFTGQVVTVGARADGFLLGTLAATAGTASFQLTDGIATMGNLIVNASAFANSGTGRGGTAQVLLNGGSLTAGTVDLDATGSTRDGLAGGAGIGGTANLAVNGATLTLNTSLGGIFVNAGGFGGGATTDGALGGSGQGGASSVSTGLRNGIGGTITTPSMFVGAHGAGGGVDFEGTVEGVAGGAGTGGTASLTIAAGLVDVDSLTVSAAGFGADGTRSLGALDGGNGGAGIGGMATITLSGGDLQAGGALVEAAGLGGGGGRAFEIFEFGYGTGTSASGGGGGIGTGGRAVFVASAGTASGSSTTVTARGAGGVGGVSAFASNGDGGDGVGGLETAGDGAILATSGSGSILFSSIAIDATGTGGDAGTGYGDSGIGGDGSGGLASLDQAGSAITVLDLSVLGSGRGGDGNELDGGLAQGGDARVRTAAGTLDVGNMSISGGALGGSGGFAGSGGDAIGGATSVIVEGGTFIFGGSVDILAQGQGGFGVINGGDATGGDASLVVRFGGVFDFRSDGDFVIRGDATGGSGSSGAGGGAIGGSATLLVDNSTLGIGESLRMSALATAQGGSTGAGSATGGDVFITVANNGELAINGLADIVANGIGGGSFSSLGAFNGGSGVGGDVTVDVGAATLRALQGMSIQAYGRGGNGGGTLSMDPNPGVAGGAGGSASGGAVSVSASDADSVLEIAGLFIDVSAFGGNGADGAGGSIGGAGGAGGAGSGGTFELRADSGQVNIFSIEGDSIDVDATGLGGDGGVGGDGSTPGDTGGDGGAGGSGTGGGASILASGGAIATGDLTFDAPGTGGDGNAGGTGAGTPAIPDDPGTPIDESQPAGPTTPAAFGFAGVGAGGKLLLRAETVGTIDAGFARLLANGVGGFGIPAGVTAIGGRIDINLGPATTGGIQLFRLDAFAQGVGLDSDQSAISIFADTGTIGVDSLAFLNSGDFIFLGAAGTGQIAVDGDLRAITNSLIQISHSGQGAPATDTIVANSIRFTSNNAILADAPSSLRADGDIEFFAGGDVTVGSATAGDDILIDAASVLVAGTAATTGLGFDGGSGNPAGSNILIFADDAIDANQLQAADSITVESTNGDVSGGLFSAGGTIDIFSGGEVDVGSAIAFETGYGADAGDVIVSAVGVARLGQAQAVGDIDVDAASIDMGDGDAGGVINLASSGNIKAGNLIARQDPGSFRFTAIEIETDGDAAVGSAVALFGDIDIDVSGSITTGDLTAGDSVRLLAGGPITTGSLLGGTYDGEANFVTGYLGSVGAGGLGPLSIASASARNDIAFATADTITIGSMTAGRDIGLVAVGDITIASADAGGQFFVGNSSIIEDLGLIDGLELEDLPAILATTPLPTEGRFVAGAVTAESIRVAAGGLVDIGSASAFGEVGYGSSPGDISIQGGSITIDLADATGNIVLNTALGGDAELATPIIGRTISTGALTAGGAILIDGLDGVFVGAAEAAGNVRIVSATTLNVGDVIGGNDVLLDGVDAIVTGNVFGARDVEIVTTIRTADIGTVRPRSISVGSAFAGDDLVIAGFGAVTTGAIGTTGTGQGGTGGLKAFYPDQPGSSVYFVSEKGGQIASIDAADDIRALNVPQSIGGVQIGDGSGGLTIGTIAAGGDVELQSPASAITITTDLAAGGRVTAISTAITINALGDLDVDLATASAGNIVIRAGGDFTANNVIATAAGGTVELAAGYRPSGPFNGDGDLILTGTVSAFSTVRLDGGGDVTIRPTGRARSDGQILIRSGDDIFVQAGGIVGLGAVATAPGGGQGQIQVGGPPDIVRMTAGVLRFGTANPVGSGLATIFIDGVVDGLAIELASEGIEIGAQARIGGFNTATLDFINNGATQTFIGGDNVGSNYVLANAEIARIRAHAITVTAPNLTGSQTDTIVRALDLLGTLSTQGQLVDTGASFRIDGSGGDVRVEGAVALTQAGISDSFGIRAGRIDVITPSGSIAITGAQGALAGGLQLEASTIFAGTDQARTDIASLLTVDSKNSRLGQSDGIDVAEGFLQANRIEFRAANGLYVQNTSAVTEPGADGRAGFTAGLPGVFILATGSTRPTEIVINGRQVSADGGFVTGDELIPFLQISGTGTGSLASFDPRSTANGCLIRGITCSVAVTETFPVQDVIDDVITPEDDFDGGDGLIQALNVPVIQMAEFSTFDYLPVIEEPVTGTGNDDLVGALEQQMSQTPPEQGTQAGPDEVEQQVTSTRNDTNDENESDAVDQQVTSTRNDTEDDEAGNVDQQVTSTRKDDEQADQPK